jgi:NTE family protein
MRDSAGPRVGLILSGGGARAAYQVGVLKAIAQILPKGASNPFPIICGTSAGAINAAVLAIYATRFQEGVKRLGLVWKNFQVHQVFRADTLGVLKSGLHWFTAMWLGGMGKYNPTSLLDRAPLRRLLERYVPCEEIQRSIDAGALRAVSITASAYTSGKSVSFYQGVPALIPWDRARRVGKASEITIDHLMASSAIPFVFSAVRVGDEYFADGSVGQMTPISPALHLGADRVLVIGVRQTTSRAAASEDAAVYPPLAEVAGHILNSIFLESLEADLERLQRINKTISVIANHELEEGGVRLRHVDALVISPSEDLGEIAQRFAHHLPRPVRFLLRGVGARKGGRTSLVSYLLFEKPYCRRLIALGYADTMQRKDEVMKFLNHGSSSRHGPICP